MSNAIEIGNPWSSQEVGIWFQEIDGSFTPIRYTTSGYPLWNYLGTLRPTIRLKPGYCLFPLGFTVTPCR